MDNQAQPTPEPPHDGEYPTQKVLRYRYIRLALELWVLVLGLMILGMHMSIELFIWLFIVIESFAFGGWLREQFNLDTLSLIRRKVAHDDSRMIQARGGLRRETFRMIGQFGQFLFGTSVSFLPSQPRTHLSIIYATVQILIAGCFGTNTVLDAAQRVRLREAIRRERAHWGGLANG